MSDGGAPQGLRGAHPAAAFEGETPVKDLRRYYGADEASDTDPRFTGGWFERLAGGGDRPAVANRVTAEDLIAVQMLSVRVPAGVAINLLERDLGPTLGRLLADIPTGLDLADADQAHVADGSPADQAWQLLRAQPGIGPVIASKLLARKRPRPLPIYDDVVRCALGWTGGFWLTLRAALRDHDHALHHQLIQLRDTADLPVQVSPLRTFDVAIWMRHHDQHRRGDCPGPTTSN